MERGAMPFLPLCVEEMDTRLCAGDVKLALLDYYPDEHAVYFCDMGADGEYRIKEIPLFELDRQNSYSAATCCIVPPAASQDKSPISSSIWAWFPSAMALVEELITADSLSLEDMTLEKMDRYWDKAKKKLK